MNTKKINPVRCKICESNQLIVFNHTATCSNCGVLLNYPYAPIRENDFLERPALSQEEHDQVQEKWLDWYIKSGERNHHNFTSMASFALSEDERNRSLEVLDYGGAGGQFALIMRSLFPKATTYIVDMQDDALLDQNKSINNQILFKDFDVNKNLYDIIFMNDVYEHLSDPIGVLSMLRKKTKAKWENIH